MRRVAGTSRDSRSSSTSSAHRETSTAGNQYRTPVNVFPTDDGYAALLGCAPQAQWVKNVLADSATLHHPGSAIPMTHPRVVGKDKAAAEVRDSARRWYGLSRTTRRRCC